MSNLLSSELAYNVMQFQFGMQYTVDLLWQVAYNKTYSSCLAQDARRLLGLSVVSCWGWTFAVSSVTIWNTLPPEIRMLSIMLRTDSRANTKTFYTASDCSTSENRLFCAVQMLLLLLLLFPVVTRSGTMTDPSIAVAYNCVDSFRLQSS